MIRSEWLAAAGLLGLASCFVTPDTLGNACVQELDCSGGQRCEQGVCVAADGSESSPAETDTQAETDTDTESETDTDTETDTGTPEPLPDGSVRVVHASPDAGPIDVYAAGSDQPLVEALAYAEVSDWLDLDIGDYGFELRPAGADPRSAPLHSSELVELEQDDRVSLIAAGLLAGGPDDALRSLAVREDWGTDLADRARARIIHAGSDAPTLTVDGLEGPPFVLSRFADSPAVGVPLDVDGGERIELFDGGALLTAFTTPPLAEGDQVLLVATGLFGALAREDDGFSLIAVGEGGLLGRVRQDPQLFTLHGAYDAGNLENCTNDFEVAANFNFGEIQSAFLSPGEYDFEIFGYPSGCTGVPLNPGGNASGMLEAGERYLLLLTGEQSLDSVGEPALQVATFRDTFATNQPDATIIRFVHGASAEQIYVGNVTDGEIKAEDVYTSPIAWRSESEPSTLAQDVYLLGVADAIGEPPPPLSPLVTFDFTSTAGAREWGIVAGDPSPEPGDKVIQLLLIDTATPGWDVEIININ